MSTWEGGGREGSRAQRSTSFSHELGDAFQIFCCGIVASLAPGRADGELEGALVPLLVDECRREEEHKLRELLVSYRPLAPVLVAPTIRSKTYHRGRFRSGGPSPWRSRSSRRLDARAADAALLLPPRRLRLYFHGSRHTSSVLCHIDEEGRRNLLLAPVRH